MTVPQILKRLSISLCLTCISTGIFASPAKMSSVKELMQVSQIDDLLRQSLTELSPYYDKQAEQIILNITKSTTLNDKERQAATQLSQLMRDSSTQIISNPKTQQAIEDIYLKTYTEEEVQCQQSYHRTGWFHLLHHQRYHQWYHRSNRLQHSTGRHLERRR